MTADGVVKEMAQDQGEVASPPRRSCHHTVGDGIFGHHMRR
ncbi:hypothetical protein [Novosphingobium taihuense]|uniref:Uncharacterized protein n=1 Tax=Novosphingobium taihuense TaxID=260085 RepID=A0A7W7ADM5_9SPHN|nr:hypothetical protein [Novosphingobium taihuense]MBB4615058.1 hypothetical protein [Novosphingobium taihuense]TWH79291.1 hypothetical protein IQ25_04012 [Novosphingobium taihuense]